MACAASTYEGKPWAGSAEGIQVDISAPGQDVWSAHINDSTYVVLPRYGTSYSTPITAGAAARWLAHHGRQELLALYRPANVPLQNVFRLLLRRTAINPSGEKWPVSYGPGVLNVEGLLAAPLPDPQTVLDQPVELLGGNGAN